MPAKKGSKKSGTREEKPRTGILRAKKAIPKQGKKGQGPQVPEPRIAEVPEEPRSVAEPETEPEPDEFDRLAEDALGESEDAKDARIAILEDRITTLSGTAAPQDPGVTDALQGAAAETSLKALGGMKDWIPHLKPILELAANIFKGGGEKVPSWMEENMKRIYAAQARKMESDASISEAVATKIVKEAIEEARG